jgi:hypothetical protein
LSRPSAVWHDQLDCLVSDAEVAETSHTAFTSKKKELHVTDRLIVRCVRDKNKGAAPGQGELFSAWRYHTVFTDSPCELLRAEEQHRGHAIIEQLLADLNDGAPGPPAVREVRRQRRLARHRRHRPQPPAGRRRPRRPPPRQARAATVRRDLVAVAARRGRDRLTLHLPEAWHCERKWRNLFEAACGPPAAAA